MNSCWGGDEPLTPLARRVCALALEWPFWTRRRLAREARCTPGDVDRALAEIHRRTPMRAAS